MKVVVLGATGFVGRHLVRAMLNRGHEVTAVARKRPLDADVSWVDSVRFLELDMYLGDYDTSYILQDADAVVDLIWPGLPNYSDLFHFEVNLPTSYHMLRRFVDAGCRQILIAGTCLEYGLQNGCLSARLQTQPEIAYPFAKDSLRRSMEFLQTKSSFCLQWARLFYVYGDGQNPKSLLPLLDAAIDRGDQVFPMSGGEQLRDFVAIESAAEQLAALVENPNLTGTFNICSGVPTSVRRLVEDRRRKRQANIDLELGKHPYAAYEPMAFWGQPHPELIHH